MPLYACPSCGKKLKVPDELLGRQVQCAGCAGMFVAERPRIAPVAAAPRRQYDGDHDYQDDGYDDRQERRSRRPSDGLPANHAVAILILGIGSLVLTLLSGLGYLLFAPLGIVFTVVGLILGLVAWIWGGKELKGIQARRLDSEGRGSVQGGWICGMIGTTLNGLTLVCTCVGLILVFAFGMALFGLASSLPTGPKGPGGPPPAPFVPPKRFHVPQLPRLPDYFPQRQRLAH
jgi:hypothetical protein